MSIIERISKKFRIFIQLLTPLSIFDPVDNLEKQTAFPNS